MYLKVLKRVIALLQIALLFFLMGCNSPQQESAVPTELTSFYDEFLDAFAHGTFSDIEPYVYFKTPAGKWTTETSFTNIYNYQIRDWEKLNDKLWVATTYAELNVAPEGCICYHFLGYIEDQLYVMIGAYEVPESLAEDEDLSRFISENALPPEDIILPIE